ncbi:MAG: sensor N-terminal transmembrane domain-containing protein, partial [Rhodobacteraceae bacterium]|nr:sensor N-terminal transmembrane domain-containing protein [Paracoccaceae bacterium]
MKMEVVTSSNDVVLGDDWVGPGDAVESEVRATRARRGLFSISSSPLARKITLFNLMALIILVAGILFTNPFRDSLLHQQEEMLGTSVQIVADIVAAAGGVEQAGSVVAQRLQLDERFELLFFNAAGDLQARTRGTAPPPITDIPDRSTVISDALSGIWKGMSFLTAASVRDESGATLDTILSQLV